MCNIKVSVIMPVYNSEEYLPETIQSVLNQSLKEFELLLIDDGSEDASGLICDQFAEKDSRVRVFHKKNGGICSARNRGLAEARGEYIAFCDNDDRYLEGLLEDNYRLAKKNNADVVRYSRIWQVIKDDVVLTEEKTEFKDAIYSSKEFGSNFDQINKAGEGVWAGIYRTAFLKKWGIMFDETMKFGYEDLDFTTGLYLHNPSIALNSNVYYVWMMRSSHSTSEKTDMNNIVSLIKCLSSKQKLTIQTEIEKKLPYFWVEELSRRIYTVVRYVSPVKVKMLLPQRIKMIKYFRTAPVFDEKPDKNKMIALRKVNKSAWLIDVLFYHKQYALLYFLVIVKQLLTGK